MPLHTNCPSCGEPIEVDDEYAGWTVRCPLCRHEFVAPAAPADAPRSRRGSSEGTRRGARAAAEAAVWLRILGVVQLAAGVLCALLFTVVGIQAANNPAQAVRALNVQNEDELWTGIVFWVVTGVAWAVAGVVALVGAGKMSRLEGRGWAVAAGVLSCVPGVNCCCVGLPVGLWVLAVLNRRDVQDAFARQRPEPDADADS